MAEEEDRAKLDEQLRNSRKPQQSRPAPEAKPGETALDDETLVNTPERKPDPGRS